MKAGLAALILAGCGGQPASLPDAAVPADADPTIDAAPAREIVMAVQPLQATELVEGVMHGGPGDTAVLHLEALQASLDWNIHGHANGGTQTVVEELGKTTVDYTYTPGATADWFLLLRNSGSTNMDVKVTVRLYGAMTWRWQ